MQQMLARTNPLDKQGVVARLVQLQRALPLAIVTVVLLYEAAFEFVLLDRIESSTRFVLEVFVFGVLGALVTWVTLEWVRRYVERDLTEREQVQHKIRELNRQLETKVAERTQELSQANEALRHRQHELEDANTELRQLDALKSEFVSLVSHELRAPLANISASLQLLLSDEDTSKLTPSQREILSLANEQAERLTRLVKGIMGVSRLEAGQMPLAAEAFDILPLITRTLEQWQACAPDYIWRGPQTQNLPSVWADPDRVEEVLTNLLENAYKYSSAGSTVQVNVYPIQDQMVICVSDQGQGIPPGELEKIFDKFHRVERGDARETYGYGLGLYISRKLIQAMGGRLWAESEMGRGSTFFFSLPLAGHLTSLDTTPSFERACLA